MQRFYHGTTSLVDGKTRRANKKSPLPGTCIPPASERRFGELPARGDCS